MTPSCFVGTKGAPRLMITCSVWARSSSEAVSMSSEIGTSIVTSSSGRASIPASWSSSSRRSRSGMRAASTWTLSSAMEGS
jgi:hypothetical protein